MIEITVELRRKIFEGVAVVWQLPNSMYTGHLTNEWILYEYKIGDTEVVKFVIPKDNAGLTILYEWAAISLYKPTGILKPNELVLIERPHMPLFTEKYIIPKVEHTPHYDLLYTTDNDELHTNRDEQIAIIYKNHGTILHEPDTLYLSVDEYFRPTRNEMILTSLATIGWAGKDIPILKNNEMILDSNVSGTIESMAEIKEADSLALSESKANISIVRLRKIGEMDPLTLGDFDAMIIEDVDYIVLE